MASPKSIEDRITAVEKALRGAREKWSATSASITSFLGGGDPAQVLGALSTIETRGVKTWAARGRGFTPATTQAQLDAWTTQGAELLRDIESIASYVAESRIERIVLDTVKASAADAVQVAKAAGGALVSVAEFLRNHWRKLAIGAAVVVVLVAVARGRRLVA